MTLAVYIYCYHDLLLKHQPSRNLHAQHIVVVSIAKYYDSTSTFQYKDRPCAQCITGDPARANIDG